MLVTLPFLLLLLDVWPLKRISFGHRTDERSNRNQGATQKQNLTLLLDEKIPLFFISAAASVIACKAQNVAGALASMNIWPLSHRLANVFVAYVEYLAKTFWPFNLAVLYPFQNHISSAKTLFAIGVLVGITLGATSQIRVRPWLPVGWFWFLGTLVPVIGLIQVGAQSMADRYTYVPLIGLFIMIVWSIPSTFFSSTNRNRLVGTMTVASLFLVGLAVAAARQVQFWETTTRLFEHALAVTEGNYMAHHLLGGALKQQGDFKGARDQFEKALQLRPDYTKARYDLGAMFIQQRDFTNALEQFQLARKNKPGDATIWNGLGMAKAHLGRIDEALSDYQQALKLDPTNPYPYANLGAALLLQGNYDEAIKMCEKALTLRSDQPETEAALAAALWNRGQTEQSIVHNRKALQLNPNLFDAQLNLGLILYKTGKSAEAIEHLQQALRLNPNHEEARKTLEAAKQADGNTSSER